MQFDYDLFVIGGGSGGVRCARMSAGYGARVAIAEEYRWGGTCVIRGCVPKKLMVYASEVRQQLHDAVGFGWSVSEASFAWPKFAAAMRAEVTRLGGIYRDLLQKAGVTLVEGRACVVGPHQVEAAGATITAKHIVLATGATPVWPETGREGWISSNELFDLPQLPARMLIVGGGYIAVEFAHVFSALGVAVTLVHRDTMVLRGFDGAIRRAVTDGLARAGVELRLGTTVVGNQAARGQVGARGEVPADAVAAAAAAGRQISLSDGTVIEVDCAVAALGRVPHTAGLWAPPVAPQTHDRGGVVVDDYGTTSLPWLHAVGDVTDRMALTPVAIREGHALADTLFGGKPTSRVLPAVATAVFTQPPVGVVGLSEEAARAAGHDIAVFTSTFRPMRNILAGRDDKTLMKLVVDKASRQVLGAHMVGADAPEIIQMAAVALTMGATKDDFDRTVAVHPTAAEEFVLMRG